MTRFALALLALPTFGFAGDLTIENAYVPLAPPGVMAHAAFLELTNTGDSPRQLIGVSAEGYAMAHIHQTREQDGIATMSAVDLIEIAPGQTVTFAHGGLHIMLMRPEAPVQAGDEVTLSLEFADGSRTPVAAIVQKPQGHSHHHHGS